MGFCENFVAFRSLIPFHECFKEKVRVRIRLS